MKRPSKILILRKKASYEFRKLASKNRKRRPEFKQKIDSPKI